MESWNKEKFVGFDTETTGVNPKNDRIVTAAIITQTADGTDTKVKEWLINPGIPIPAEATAVHGITTEYAQENGCDAHEALDEIANCLTNAAKHGYAILAFNANFDFSLLQMELQRHNLPSLEQRLGGDIPIIIDPLVIDRAVDRFRRGKRQLANLVAAYQLPTRDFHNANADVLATLDLWRAISQKEPRLLELTAPQLLEWQRQAHLNWATNFEEYLRKKVDPKAFVAKVWPY